MSKNSFNHKKMTLLKECIDALGNDTIVLSKKETDELFDRMSLHFAITSWGQIDWNVIQHKKISSVDKLTECVDDKEAQVYILWDEATLPSIKTNLGKTLAVLDDVRSVSFDTWIYSPTQGYVIEFYHENEIHIGWIN